MLLANVLRLSNKCALLRWGGANCADARYQFLEGIHKSLLLSGHGRYWMAGDPGLLYNTVP